MIRRSFTIDAPPEEAQRRFRDELTPALKGRGFMLRDEHPGHLEYGVRAFTAWAGLSLLAMLIPLQRALLGHHVHVEFLPTPEGSTRVEVYGRAGRSVTDDIDLLGRPGHWPENLDDRVWPLPVEDNDQALVEWEQIDPGTIGQQDRITRRALKRAGRRSG